jgi:hypothetical protein
MKIILLIGGGRNGIDLIQSLFDKHPEVSQFPGAFDWMTFYKSIASNTNPQDIAEFFIKEYPHFFDSRLNLQERHDQLGELKDSYYLVDKIVFKNNFVNLFENKTINRKNILTCLHLSYSIASGEDVSKKNLILINVHLESLIKEFDDFDFEILYSVRNPIASLSSGVKHWLLYKSGKKHSPWQTYFFIDRQFNALKNLIKKNYTIHVVKLELLHTESERVIKNLSKKLELKYVESSLESTYHGKKWWGDALSKKYLDGLNPNFENNIDYNFFYQKDINLIKYYLKDLFIKYDYLENGSSFKNKYLRYFPLKIELIVFKKELLKFNLKNIIFAFYYWFKRVKLMKEGNFKNIDFPSDVSK